MALELETLEENLKRLENVLYALKHLASGKPLILTDDEDRENEGDVIFPAEDCTPDKMAFVIRKACGLVCLSLDPKVVDHLELPLLTAKGKLSPRLGTAFTVSIEAKEGISTGISASDRCQTVLTAINDATGPSDLIVPGHVFPLRAKAGGCLERCGHTEASIDLMKLAGKKPAAVICEILKEDGELARALELKEFSEKYDLPLLSIGDLVIFRMLKEKVLDLKEKRLFETESGTLQGSLYSSLIDESLFVFLKQKTESDNSSLQIELSESNFSTQENSNNFFSKALFASKNHFSSSNSRASLMHFRRKGSELNDFQKKKLSGFVSKILIEENLHRGQCSFSKPPQFSNKNSGLDLNLAPPVPFSYKDLS